ncbi:MAG TPA: amino acid adenylation domain-containing protein [Pyrinomonadaceae bacterium]
MREYDDILSAAGLDADKLELLDYLLEEEGLEGEARTGVITPVERAEPSSSPYDAPQQSSLSYAQQRLWFLDQFEPGRAAYNIAGVLRMEGRLDAAALGRSLDEIVRRHESLRTSFASVGGSPVQVIAPACHLALGVEELTALAADEREAELRRLAREEAARPFDLRESPLMRARLLRLSGEEHVLLLTMHHIVSDGWSLGVFARELAALYGAFTEGRPSPLPELAVQYADYAAWQRERLAGEVIDTQLDYWRRQLGGDLPMLELAAGRPRPAARKLRGATQTFGLSAGLREELKALAREEDATLFMALVGAFKALLWRYTGQGDILVGTPVAGRTRAEVEPLIGCFINTLVLRTRLDAGLSFRGLLRRVRETALGAYAHQEVPFERVVEELHPERSLDQSPLFQVMFTMQNAPTRPPELPGLKLSLIEVDDEVARFDLSLEVAETPDGMRGMLHYDTDLFDAESVARMAVHLQTLLEGAAARPDTPVSRLPLLTEGELRLLLGEWNATAADYPRDSSVHELFERQAEETPEAVALVFGEGQLTYAELNRRANQLARHLITLGVGPEVRVGIMLERSPEMVVGLLGILKAGGAYVPLDPAYPHERLAFMTDDASVSIIVTLERHSDAAFAPLIVCLDADWPAISGGDADNPPPGSAAEHLAYVMYTSGSTGVPKGVGVAHRAVARLVKGANYADFSRDDIILQLAPLGFDASTVEIWGALLNGARLVLPPQEDSASLEAIGAHVRRHRVTKLWLTAGLFHLMVDYRLEDLRGLEQILAGGDVLSPPHVERVVRELGGCRMTNCYGPTENTTFTTCHDVGPDECAGSVPIGTPISNTRVYVLDEGRTPVAVGVVGELYAGGDGLARGYLNRPALTAEKFVPDPFSGEPGARLYRTGDLARRRADGVIEFVGRGDQQVKVRGYRIELEEIKSALGKHTAVRECLVVVREDAPGDKRVVAYLTPARVETPNAAELRHHLREKLPEYMVPSAFVWLEEFPLTANAKVDREALPAPEHPVGERQSAYTPPRTPVEEALAGIWADVLGVEQVGVHDNFFELGGHSLLATQVVTRVRESLRADVSLRQFFESPVIAELASLIEPLMADGRAGAPSPMLPVPRGRALPLSFAQQRLWFLDQFDSGNPIYNVPVVLRLGGPLDVGALERTLNEVVRRHEALRTVFRSERGGPMQVILPKQPIVVPVLNLAGLNDADRDAEARRLASEEAQKGFDLTRGPLLRATLLRLGADEHMLLFTMHHIVSDGWSVGLLVREVAAVYTAYVRGQESPLPELTLQYADYAVWQREWLQGEVLEEQLAYWKRQLEPPPPGLGLPTDRPRPEVLSHRGATLNVDFPAGLTDGLKELSRREGVTLYMTLLAAFQALLHRHTGRDDIAVGSPIANRQRSEIEPLIGFFVNTLVMRTDLSGDPSFRALLGRVQEVTLGAYAHQDVPFEMLVEELQPDRSLGTTPFFQVAFALQNAPGEELKLPGLTLKRVDVQSRTARFDLSLLLEESAEGLTGLVEYSADLFDEKTVRRLLEHLQALLGAAVADPEERLSALPLLADAEGRKLIARRGDDARADSGPFVKEMFERQVEATPGAAALVHGEQQFTYEELNRRANRLAHRLRRLGVGPEVVAAVMTERPIEAVLGALAVLKAGGAYLPLDPAEPRERLAFVLRDAAAGVVLTQKHLEPLLPEGPGAVCRPDADWETLAPGEDENPATRATPDGLAFVTYTSGTSGTPNTSGSAGRPKAVGVRHSSLAVLIRALTPDAGSPAPRTLQLAPFVQDIASQEIFSTLCAGGTLVLAPEEARKDSRALWRLLAGERVERLFLTPTRLRHLAEAAGAGDEPPRDLRRIISAGEGLRIDGPVREMFAGLPGCVLEVNYAQPETQLAARWSTEGAAGGWPTVPPLGDAVAGAQLFVLDSRLRPVPAGVVGELYVGGAGVARGHLNRAVETALGFIPHPFSQSPGARLYRTGDLARQAGDGRLEYVGRVDTRVTVRGYRVELEEVEAVLGLHPAVRRAAVRLWEDEAGRRHLVAYVLGEPGASPNAAELRGHLREKLPAYMVPSTFLLLEDLPLTRGGEVDRRRLPAPDEAGGEVKEGHVAPRTLTEEVLAGVWAGLLKAERVGVNDNFFDLGGHSLLATQLVSEVREAFGVELPLRRLFERPTVAGLAESIEESLRDGRGAQTPPITRRPRDGRLPLSFAQQRLWFIHQLEPENATYHIAAAVQISGALDAGALGLSLAEIVRRHEVLRTSFAVADGQPAQVISPDTGFDLPVIDLSGGTEAEREEERRRLAREEASRPFDLTRGPLLRATLLRLSGEEHVLLFAMHHIVSDGWSVGVMVRELAALYESYAAGGESPLEELAVQYADYAAWQRERLAGEVLDTQLDYWRRQLAGAPPMLDLPTARPRQVVQTFRGAGAPLELSAELTARLKALAGAEGVTLFMTLLGAFQTLLWRYTGQDDILVGTPIANRTRAETEPLIGFFVNTLVMRARPSAGQTFRELLRETRETALGAYAHQEVPFERVVEELQPERTLSHAPLFQVMFALQNAPAAPLKLASLRLNLVEIPSETARFDLTLSLAEDGGRLSGQLEYNSDLFDADAVALMLGHYRRLLESAVEDPCARLSELELLTEEERRRLLAEWNDTAREAAPPACAHELFERRAAAQPRTPAVVFGGERLSYAELNGRANRLARYLRRLGVRAETPVCVCFERGVELVIATLAVVKAGGAYVPLDPSNPAERLSFMLKDSRAPVLLTGEAQRGLFDAGGAEVVSLDRDREAIALEGGDNLGAVAAPDNLAYVVYTSGSTGTPKGVEVAHASLANLIHWYRRTSNVGPGERATQLSGVGFDATVLELWSNLASGASLHLPDAETRLSPERLRDWLVSNGVAVCFAATPLAELLLALPWPRDAALRLLHTGGDKLHRFPEESLPFGVVNNYGPSESTVIATSGRVEPGAGVTQSPTIGRPIDNAEVYLLDEGLRPVPAGVRGELYVGGGCLARGYLRRSAQTAERFIPHPFSATPGARLYRTGDLARFLPDGRIEFLGRLDNQIKIRGHRIELGEIEAVLVGHGAVREGVVECREAGHGEKRLTAYVAAREGESLTADELRGYLAERLPGYMVPSAFVCLERLPHNANGKIDRQALPDADDAAGALGAAYVEPATGMERTVAGLWRELLGLERVGLHDNFFDLGGHSLLVVRMQGRLQEILGREITVAEVFKYPTVSTLAWHLSRGPLDERGGGETHQQRGAARRESIRGRARRARGRESVNGEQ